VTSQAATSETARGLDIPGLPADVRVRALDPAVDFPALAEFMGRVNLADGNQSAMTAEEVAINWRRTPGFEPTRDALVVEDGDGFVAHVNVDAQLRAGKVVHWIEGWVRQDRRRNGIGRALLRWAERHSADLVARREASEPDLPHVLGFGVLESIPAAMAFAAAAPGYTRIRYGFEMRRPLDEPIPDTALPAGIELRPVREADHRRIWDADVEAFRDHWEPRDRDESDYEATFTYPDLDTSLWRVAWDGDEVVGAVMNAIFREENAKIGLDIGWLEHVSVRKAWRGRGIARALIASSVRALRERGMAIAALGVDGENLTGALRLYEGLGFRRHETWITYRKPLTGVEGPGQDG
jgi:mycothiol synthase